MDNLSNTKNLYFTFKERREEKIDYFYQMGRKIIPCYVNVKKKKSH